MQRNIALHITSYKNRANNFLYYRDHLLVPPPLRDEPPEEREAPPEEFIPPEERMVPYEDERTDDEDELRIDDEEERPVDVLRAEDERSTDGEELRTEDALDLVVRVGVVTVAERLFPSRVEELRTVVVAERDDVRDELDTARFVDCCRMFVLPYVDWRVAPSREEVEIRVAELRVG